MPTSTASACSIDRHGEVRGWTAFARSGLGQLAALVAIAAVGLTTVVPVGQVPSSARLGQIALAFIALGCTAVLAYRDDPQH